MDYNNSLYFFIYSSTIRRKALMKRHVALALAALFCGTTLFACISARDHRENLGSTAEREITAGNVKRFIKKGISGAEVAEALGSPNITTKDDNGRETWVYDKIATEVSYDQSNMGWFLFLAAGSQRSGASSQTQRTLTVVIKFDANDKVDTFSYHQSKF